MRRGSIGPRELPVVLDLPRPNERIYNEAFVDTVVVPPHWQRDLGVAFRLWASVTYSIFTSLNVHVCV